MFEVKMMVETKKLGDVLKALDGLIVMSSIGITQVRNATVATKGNVKKVVEKNQTNGEPVYMKILHDLIEAGNMFPTNSQIAKMLPTYGCSPTSSGGMIKILKDKGYIRQKALGEYAITAKANANGA